MCASCWVFYTIIITYTNKELHIEHFFKFKFYTNIELQTFSNELAVVVLKTEFFFTAPTNVIQLIYIYNNNSRNKAEKINPVNFILIN